MNVCGQCKSRFNSFSILKDHFKTDHRKVYVAICLWLGPETDKQRLEDWWFYELRFTRRHKYASYEKQVA